MVFINGQQEDVAGMSVAEYLKQIGLSQSRVALELNASVLSSSLFSQYRFKDGDKAELVHFVGGG